MKNRIISNRILRDGCAALSVTLLCASCTSWYAPESRTADAVPSSYRAAIAGTPAQEEWWRAFGDEQLDRLMAHALSGNLSIEQSAARLRQAEALAVRSGAARFPELSGTAGARTIYDYDTAGQRRTTDKYSLGLAASYEIDLWGRVASGHRAALRTLKASRFDLQTAAMTVAGQTAISYFQWQQLEAQKAVLTAQLASRRKMLSVIEKRFQAAQADALDVLQQRAQVAASEAAIPPVEAALQVAYNTLATLIGEPPQTDLNLAGYPLPELPGYPDAGLPAGLLVRRPDLQAAWARLEAADWNTRAAQADRLPAITLTGTAAYEAEKTDALFDNWVMNLAAGLTAPLIDGGFRRAEVARTKAVADEQVAAYRESVLNALTEVENALSTEARQHEYLAAVRRQLNASAAAADEALSRYTRGLESYFETLVAETLRQNLEVTVLLARFDLLTARVQLYRVLGGDWASILNTYRTAEQK
jgi:NodT family efflux transporter outer membrane factor (OMF) lipoprotein